jgi:hypothetical protein
LTSFARTSWWRGIADARTSTDVTERAGRILTSDGEQRLLRGAGLAIDEVHDRAGVLADDRGVWVRREITHRGRVPVIAPRQPAGLVHPLLHDRPVTVARQDERMEIDLKAVRDGVVVHARGEPAGADQRVAIEVDALGDRAQFVRCLARLLAASAADVHAELVGPRVEASLQGTHHRGGDAGGVPVHPHHDPSA